MADKEHSDTQEKIKLITYSSAPQDSGDLEAGTHTIVPTSQPVIGSAQYSKALTLTKPTDARLEVMRIACRLSVNIAGLGTATHVYYSVRVDVDDSNHELFSEDWTSTGAKLDAVDTHSGGKATIFNLLKDGSAHTFYFLFWADVASQATIDVVQLWEGIGSKNTSVSVGSSVLKIVHKGFLSIAFIFTRHGTGSATARILAGVGLLDPYLTNDTATWKTVSLLNYPASSPTLWMSGSVATDINCLYRIYVTLRSEQ